MGRRSLAQDTAAFLALTFGAVPFSLEDALDAGVPRDRLYKAIRAGAVSRLRRGVYVVPSEAAGREGESPWHIQATHSTNVARGAALALSDCAVSLTSAALLLGLPVPQRGLSLGHVTRPGGKNGRTGGVQVHSAMLPESHVTVLAGLRVTSPARTALDIARTTSLPDALICMDAVLRRYIDHARDGSMPLRLAVHESELIQAAHTHVADVLADMRGWAGTRNARRALEWADPAAESAFESESRGALLEYGVPRPACGFPIVGANGRTYWADMAWRDGRVVGECDGLIKYSDPRVLYEEKLRQEALENAGSKVVRWTRSDIVRSPQRVAERILNALSRID